MGWIGGWGLGLVSGLVVVARWWGGGEGHSQRPTPSTTSAQPPADSSPSAQCRLFGQGLRRGCSPEQGLLQALLVQRVACRRLRAGKVRGRHGQVPCCGPAAVRKNL